MGKQAKHAGQFQKGKSGNPGGRKPIPADIKELKQIRTEEFQRALYSYMGMTVEELKVKAANASQLTWLELILIRAVERTSDSDWKAITDVLDRALAKRHSRWSYQFPGGGPIELKWPDGPNPTT